MSKNRIGFYTIDTDYCDYLRKFDSKVPYTMDSKQTRPFIGILLTVNENTYYAPLSSPKPKHLKMKKNHLKSLKNKAKIVSKKIRYIVYGRRY